jgi:hypothetical protein
MLTVLGSFACHPTPSMLVTSVSIATNVFQQGGNGGFSTKNRVKIEENEQ